MKKCSFLFCSFLLVFLFHSTVMAAALPTGTLLTLDNGYNGAVSYWTIQTGMASFSTISIRSTKPDGTCDPRSTDCGILFGVAQNGNPGASHSGYPVPGDTGPIDVPWDFLSNTGHHFTVGNGVANADPVAGTADMSNWRMTWNGIPVLNMGGDPFNFPADTGMATFTVVGTNSVTLDYNAHFPLNDLSGFGGVPYSLHIEGRIISAAVPEPSSLLLIGSGLAGLWGLMRKR